MKKLIRYLRMKYEIFWPTCPYCNRWLDTYKLRSNSNVDEWYCPEHGDPNEKRKYWDGTGPGPYTSQWFKIKGRSNEEKN